MNYHQNKTEEDEEEEKEEAEEQEKDEITAYLSVLKPIETDPT